jgi:hypothetical protein
MLYGCELWAITKTELEMLERSHRKIICTIQGLHVCCPNAGLLAAMGSQTIADTIAAKKLLFIHSVISLPEHALPHQVLVKQLQTGNAKAWLPIVLESLDALNLPFPNDMLLRVPTKPVWKRVVAGVIRLRAEMSLLDEAEQKSDLQLFTQMDRQPDSPSPLWASTHCKDLLHLTSKNNFRVRLLLGCHGLEIDAARFRVRKGGLRVGSSTCRLCDQGDEDPTHFLATCPALAGMRAELLQAMPLALHVVVPDPAREPDEITSTLLGVPWIDDREFQEFAISFITELKALVQISC